MVMVIAMIDRPGKATPKNVWYIGCYLIITSADQVGIHRSRQVRKE
jgi:hypothetical protein